MIETFEELASALDALSLQPGSGAGPEAIASRLLALAEARGDHAVVARLRPDEDREDRYLGRFALLADERFEVFTAPELVDPVARVLAERSGATVGSHRPGRIDGASGHFRVRAHSGPLGTEVFAWRRDRAQEARMPSPAEAGFDDGISRWLEQRYVELEDCHSHLLVVAAERIEETRATIDLLLGLLDDPRLNVIATQQGGISTRAPWLFQIDCQGERTLPNTLRAALRQDPDVVVASGPSVFDDVQLLANIPLTGHALIATLAAPSAQAAHEHLRTLAGPLADLLSFHVLFVREQTEGGRLRLSGELKPGR